jgi:predicted 3-demethylubiquinone-9 3-methyltransferase (glyoxalase superfamily)
MQKLTTFLMFEGRAEEAMNFYVTLFENSRIETVKRFGPGEEGQEGTVVHAVFSLHGQQFMAIDSSVKHGFTFTPSMSLFVECASEDEVNQLFGKLSEGGEVLMPLDRYPFSQRFAWVNDRFGVSWQLSFATSL